VSLTAPLIIHPRSFPPRPIREEGERKRAKGYGIFDSISITEGDGR